MRTWWKQLLPYLITLSLIANAFLGLQIYNRDRDLNLYTWGNAVDTVWKEINWASGDLVPRSDGRVMPQADLAVRMALDDLELLRSLPHYSKRVPEDDMRTLEQFLRYANQAYFAAAKEQGAGGTVSAQSAQRLARVKEALEFILRHQSQTNRAKSSRYPWNHGEWRAVWADIAAGLRAMDFVPLDE